VRRCFTARIGGSRCFPWRKACKFVLDVALQRAVDRKPEVFGDGFEQARFTGAPAHALLGGIEAEPAPERAVDAHRDDGHERRSAGFYRAALGGRKVGRGLADRAAGLEPRLPPPVARRLAGFGAPRRPVKTAAGNRVAPKGILAELKRLRSIGPGSLGDAFKRRGNRAPEGLRLDRARRFH